MISTSIILSTGEKKWMPMKFFGSFDCSASEVIGRVEVFEPNTTLSPTTACAFAVASAFTLRSSNTASMTRSHALELLVVRRRRDAREQRVGVGLLGAAALDLSGHQVRRIGLALVGRLLIAVDQHHVHAGLRRHVGDAGAHQAGAEHADLLDRRRRLRLPAGARPC